MQDFEDIFYAEDQESLDFLGRCYRDPVLFAESFFRNDAGELYQLEPHQKAFLRDEASNRVLFWGRRMGKSEIVIIDMMHKTIFTPNYSIFAITPFANQAERLSEQMSDIIHRSDGIISLFTKDIQKKKHLVNRSKIQLSTAGKDTTSGLIGGGANYVFMDEAQDLSEILYSKIRPILRGQILGDPKIVFSGTPRARQGFFYNSINNAYRIYEDNQVTQNPEGIYSLHRKPTVFLDEEDNIISTGTPRITIDEMEEEKIALSLMEFKQEYALQFLDTLGKVFPTKLIEECESNDPLEFGSLKPCVAGLDFGKINNNSVLFIAEFDKYKNLEIKYMHEWELGTKYTEVTDFMKNTIPKHYPKLIKLSADITGVGQGVLEHFDGFTTYEVEPIMFSQRSKIDLVENTVAMMEANKISYPYHKRFQMEMSQYMREIGKNNLIKYVKGESDDYVDAYVLCVRAGTTAEIPVDPQVIQIGSNLLGNKVNINQPPKLQRNNNQNLYKNRRIRV